jgi:hypothetical protein
LGWLMEIEQFNASRANASFAAFVCSLFPDFCP